MKLAAIFAKTWYSAYFHKNTSRKSGPAPETKIAFFGFLYSQKQKKRGAPTGIPAQPRPEAPSLWDGHRKSNTFFHQPCPFSVFSYSLFMENNPTEPKTSPHSPLPTKNNKIYRLSTQKAVSKPKTSHRKNDSRKWGRTIYLESVPEGTPSLPFFKNWCNRCWKSTIYKMLKIFTFVASE